MSYIYLSRSALQVWWKIVYTYFPDKSCGGEPVVEFLCIGFLRTQSSQETWFGLVTGILLFLVLLRFGSIWEGPTSESCLEVPNTQHTHAAIGRLRSSNCRSWSNGWNKRLLFVRIWEQTKIGVLSLQFAIVVNVHIHQHALVSSKWCPLLWPR